MSINKIEKKIDHYSIKSASVLKQMIHHHIKRVFVSALKIIEIKFGKNFEGYEALRAEILRTGNDSIRDIEKAIDTRFNIEQIPEILIVKFKDKNKGEVKDGTDS
jgi:hypothetical protein